MSRPAFQMPFMCHQKWLASTYDGHYPDQDSIDLRRYSGNTNVSHGAPVFASAGGTVSEVGSDWYGDWVYIDHGGGWKTHNIHINKLAAMVKGTVVVRGEKIGSVGTFSPMEPHLHYTQLKDDQAVRAVFNQVAIAVHAGAKKSDGSYPMQTITSANCPTGCTKKTTPAGSGGSVTCTAGAGVRVVVQCLTPWKQIEYTRRGPWVGATDVSAAHCLAGHEFIDHFYEISQP